MDAHTVKEHFWQVLDLPDGERAAYLDELARSDPAVHREVAALVEVHDRTDAADALEEPVRAGLERLGRAAGAWPRLRGYRVVRPLGEGGMGMVYLAERESDGLAVAIKVLHAASRAVDSRGRLLEEGAHIRRVQHPNVVRVVDLVQRPHRTALVLEYVDGPSLAALLAAPDGSLSLEDVDALARELLEGVGAIHRAGLVHADLKPSNVLLALAPDRIQPKVADFGLAKSSGAMPRTLTRHGAGTMQYMSREQEYGETPRPAWDVFALGVVLFELVDGRRPFPDAASRARTLDEGRAPVPIRDALPMPMRRAIAAALGPAADRPEDASALLAIWQSESVVRPAYRPETVAWAQEVHARASSQTQHWDRTERVALCGVRSDAATLRTRARETEGAGTDLEVDVVFLDDLSDGADRVANTIEGADEVHVLWSARAKAHPQSHQFLALIADESWARASRREPLHGYLVAWSDDGTPLPGELDDRPGRPAPEVFLTVAGLAAVIAYGWVQGWEGWTNWLLLGGMLGFATVVLVMQWVRAIHRIEWAGQLYREGAWLDRTSLPGILARAERLLSWIYGPTLLSWRSFRVSAILSTVPVVLVALVWGGSFVLGEIRLGRGLFDGLFVGLVATTGSLGISAPLALCNVGLDYASLLVTRSILLRLRKNTPLPWLAVGLGLDFAAVLLLGVLGVCTNLIGLLFFAVLSGSYTGWLSFVWTTTWLALSGGLGLSNALVDAIVGPALVTAVMFVTATFPSLLHAGWLGAGILNRVAGHLPFRVLGRALKGLALTPRGPWTIALPLAAVATVLLTAQPPVPPAPPPSSLVDVVWVPLQAETLCGKACEIGCDLDHPWCDPTEQRRPATLSANVSILQSEVTQRLWEAVWDRAEHAVPDRLGLARRPSVYRGDDLPVDNISWCDAARFANLWTLLDDSASGSHRDVPYCMGHPCDPSLDGCEARTDLVRWNPSSRGYRLPTEAEWELACLGGSEGPWWTGSGDRAAEAIAASEWLSGTARWQSQPARLAPDDATRHPLGLTGMSGNVSEWLWDEYRSPPNCTTCSPFGRQFVAHGLGVEDVNWWWTEMFDPTDDDGRGRVLKGASWYGNPRHARCAFRVGPFAAYRHHTQGFRLAVDGRPK